MATFAGFDHVDCRVRSLRGVEAFYDALMPELGLSRKRYSFVDEAGEWHEASPTHTYNAIEFFEAPQADRAPCFIGFIERADHVCGQTRIAFRVAPGRLFELEDVLHRVGACNVQRSEDLDAYPAIFFEDPGGTRLEIIARAPVALELAG